ncbi:hypothetical protein [Nocardioides sp. P5_C9_2]
MSHAYAPGPVDGEHEYLSLELWTVATPGVATFMRKVADVLSSHPAGVPTRVGAGDPAMTPVVDLRSQLVELGRHRPDDRPAQVLLARPEVEEHGRLTYVPDPFGAHPPGFVHPSRVEIGLSPEDPSEAGELLAQLAEAVEALYGFVVWTPHARQARGRLLSERVRRHGPSPSGGRPPTWKPPPYQALEAQLPDVFWVQVFGPAFVEMWGERALESAGVRRRVLGHGGYVVWATQDPPAYDDHVDAPEGYAWKGSVYDVIGPEPFLRADRCWNDFGEHVPLMTQHAAALTG